MKKIPGCMLISAAVVGCVLVSGCETSDYTDNVTTGCVDETGEIAETDYNISIYDSFETDIFIDMEENNEDGADWRTTGIIIDYGIITRNGKSVDVVVTLDNEGASFYYNSSNKKLFESVSFPFSITDSWDAYNAVYFDDVNSDGESDVTLHFHHDDYTFTQLVWYWDNNGYVYREELSCLRDEPIWVNEDEPIWVNEME